MTEKIVLVTAGGHISSFHAAMRSMHETLEEKTKGKFELFGARGGLSGLIKGELEKIYYSHIEEDRAGSLIGADREIAATEQIARVVKKENIYAIVMMGGDNHLNEAEKCHDVGLKIVGYPKTMDGDLSSFISLGWESAVTKATKEVIAHYNTALTNRRVFFAGLFGRGTDWVPCAVSLYSGADRCIPCEEEYELDYVLEKIKGSIEENEKKYGIPFSVVVYSEGAKIKGLDNPPDKHLSFDKHQQPKMQPEWVGLELVRLSKGAGISACFQAHTYSLRDCEPTETDKTLSRMAGRECINMILDGDFGNSVSFVPEDNFYRVVRKPLEEVAVQRRLKPTGYFDYKELKTTKKFFEDYGNLFRVSLGNPPNRDQLVYRNMLKRN